MPKPKYQKRDALHAVIYSGPGSRPRAMLNGPNPY